MNLDVRPLTVGELFDRAFTMYRRNLWTFAGIAALPAALAAAVGIVTQIMQQAALSTVGVEGPAAEAAATQTVWTTLWMAASVVLLAIGYWVVYMIALGATTYAVSELYVGRPSAIKQAYSGVRGDIGALIVLMLVLGLRVMGIMVVGGVLFALAVGVGAVFHPVVSGMAAVVVGLTIFGVFMFFMLRWSIAVPALIVEGLGPGDSIRRSAELTKGRLGRVFLLVLCAMMVTYATMMIFQVPFTIGALVAGPMSTAGFWLNVVGAIFGAAGSTFTTPFLIIGLALLYYDARIREEGFDLQLTLEALDARAGVARV